MSSPPAQQQVLGLIGGSSFLSSSALSSFQVELVSTAFGDCVLRHNPSKTVYFVQRHAANPEKGKEYSPPHLINHRAIAKALQHVGVSVCIGFGSVGSLKRTLPCGTLLLPDDWLHFNTITTFQYQKDGHVGPKFDNDLRGRLYSLLSTCVPSLPVLNNGVYAQTLGPRFETAAEIRSLAIQGADIVGMTCASEATLMNELNIPYAIICMIDNMANGIEKPITYAEFHEGVTRNLVVMERVLAMVLDEFTPDQPHTHTHHDMRKIVDLVIHARYIVPVLPAAVLENYSLIVHDEKIVDILPTVDAKQRYKGKSEEDLENHVLLPGLVNCHTHLGMTMLRGFADDHCLSDWLVNHIWPAEREFCSPEFVQDSTELGIAEMLRSGTTTFNDMYFFPEVCAKIVETVGVRAAIGLIFLDFPTAYASGPDQYIQKAIELHAQYPHHKRISFTLAPHAPYTVCDANFQRLQELARTTCSRPNRPAQLQCHIHETRSETQDSESGTPSMAKHRSEHKCRPLSNLHRLNIVNENLVAIHMTQLNESEIDILAAQKAHVVHCPTSNLKLASGFCPVWPLTKAGVNVALGTDSSGSNNGLDLMAEIKLAAILAKGVTYDATALPAYDALKMATINGAKALGLDHEIGSLQVGKYADFIAIDLNDLETLPLFDVVSHVVYSATKDKVSDVWVAGARLMRARHLTCLDVDSIRSRVKRWQEKLMKFRDKNQKELEDAKAARAKEESAKRQKTN